jgi:hypothetical protein
MADDVSEVQKLRQKLNDAVRLLARHVAEHPEIKFSQEHLRLFLECQELERQLDRLDNRTKDTA